MGRPLGCHQVPAGKTDTLLLKMVIHGLIYLVKMVSFHSYFSLPEGMTLGFSDTAPRKDTAESSLPPREDTNKQHSDRRLIMWSSNQSPVKSHVLDVYILSIYIYIYLMIFPLASWCFMMVPPSFILLVGSSRLPMDSVAYWARWFTWKKKPLILQEMTT